MQIDEERSLRSVGKEGDCRRKTTVTFRHERVCDKHDQSLKMPKSKIEAEVSEGDTASEGPSTSKKRQLDGVCLNYSISSRVS